MRNVLKTIIVDDEALARRGLKHRLAEISDLQVIAEARNGREALALIRDSTCCALCRMRPCRPSSS
jgi:two-component system LytT family response regulator